MQPSFTLKGRSVRNKIRPGPSFVSLLSAPQNVFETVNKHHNVVMIINIPQEQAFINLRKQITAQFRTA